ncbi:MAG: PorT family protein [Flavobacteriaceae bacterium]|nr:PorT family protein [Flavobacteriaceae bacterium]
MEDNFDKILRDKIKEVSKNQDFAYNPEHWRMLMAKKKSNKKRVLFYWQFAAFVLIALLAGGLGKYFFQNSNHIKQEIIIDTNNDSLRIDTLKNSREIFITSSSVDSINNLDKKNSVIDSLSNNNKSKIESILKSHSKTEIATTSKQRIYPKQKIEPKDAVIAVNSVKLHDSIEKKSIINLKTLLTEAEMIAKNENIDTLNESTDMAFESEIKKQDSTFIKQGLVALIEEEETDEKSKRSAIKFGIDVSPIINYTSENENSNVGYSGGVLVEIPIATNFDISTGVYYANQKLDLNQPNGYSSDVVSAKNSSQLVTKEAITKGLEIPVNVKYNFSLYKKNVFISVGFTSTSYFTEDIEANYLKNGRTETSTQDLLGNNIVKYKLVQTEEKIVTPNNSNNFNFANILNFSLGLELPLNNNYQSIIIEPYFKYSLKPITAQKVDFSSAGIHFRYNFSFSRKK